MKAVFWLGVVLLALGIASLFVPIPHTEKQGFKVGDASVRFETRHDEKVSPIISTVLIVAGAGMLVIGKKA
ncbi:MAG TPA: hypothetical protein VLT16_10585 [Candidatus Limnocylindrales bacterium]|nr:hypothetical protein [Candidatus Limnocylindrales bacterium]